MTAIVAAYSFYLAHQGAILAFLFAVLPTLITGLTAYPQAQGTVSALRLILNVLSVVSHKDSPGTFKLPMTVSADPGLPKAQPPLGFARLRFLVVLAIAGLFVATAAAHADEAAAAPAPNAPVIVTPAPKPTGGTLADVAPSDPLPTPPASSSFGGCTKSGKVCFSPSVGVSIAAINLSTKKIEAAFSPGIGYGFTVNPGKWSSFGLDAQFVLNPGAQQASASIVAKLFNGYLRAGISKGLIGDTDWRVPFALGVDL